MKYVVRSGDGYFIKFIFGNTPYMTTELAEAHVFTSHAQAEAVKNIMTRAGYVANIVMSDYEAQKRK